MPAEDAVRASRGQRSEHTASASKENGKGKKEKVRTKHKEEKRSKDKDNKEKKTRRSSEVAPNPVRGRSKKLRAASEPPWSASRNALRTLGLDPTLCLALGIAAVTPEAIARKATHATMTGQDRHKTGSRRPKTSPRVPKICKNKTYTFSYKLPCL